MIPTTVTPIGLRCVAIRSSFGSLLSNLTLLLPLLKERERHCNANLSFISSTSTLSLYSTTLNLLKSIEVHEIQDLCAGGLLLKEKVGMRFYSPDSYASKKNEPLNKIFYG